MGACRSRPPFSPLFPSNLHGERLAYPCARESQESVGFMRPSFPSKFHPRSQPSTCRTGGPTCARDSQLRVGMRARCAQPTSVRPPPHSSRRCRLRMSERRSRKRHPRCAVEVTHSPHLSQEHPGKGNQRSRSVTTPSLTRVDFTYTHTCRPVRLARWAAPTSHTRAPNMSREVSAVSLATWASPASVMEPVRIVVRV